MTTLFSDLNPPPRLLMGPGPVGVDPRVLRAMSMPMLGQFDPAFTAYMNEMMELIRQLYRTKNKWSLLIDGTARAGVEAILVSIISPGDKVLVPSFGRFGFLLAEIAKRCGGEVVTIERDWGTVFTPEEIEAAVRQHKPRVLAVVHGDTSTTMAQPLDQIGAICRKHDVLLYTDATASLGGMNVAIDDWQVDAASSGLQKCLSGPPGSSPITVNERIVDVVKRRRHVEGGIRPANFVDGDGPVIQSNYFDLGMIMDYWSEMRLNHHTEATSMLYAAREAIRIVLAEGLDECFARHALASDAITAGLTEMGLKLFGDQTSKMPNVTGVHIPDGINGDAVRSMMLNDFGIEIGTSFGPLHGKIWRIGTMGYVCRKESVLTCLAALEVCLRQAGFRAGSGTDAALAVYRAADEPAHRAKAS
ncbi:pyridoxal-phosphate-dependent aminotransferase family protein [Pseudorhodoplanes sp.]|uniref:pyridoxal-phosphate-dependent aminotransferase family protein n=1 Tax=Pseudorhodoplanes sp. TaxID=1934341 RepID=UPI00391C4983